MDIDVAFRLMKQSGYCLWVGAGVSIHAASATKSPPPPTWAALVAALEAEAKLSPPSEVPDFSQRLDAVLRVLGRERFQKQLRTRVHDALALCLVDSAREHAKKEVPIPKAVRQLAHLGRLANPIVNFNVEHLTSMILAGAEPYAVRAFVPKVAGGSSVTGGNGPSSQSEAKQHQRAIYHPHGAVAVGGFCVMTASEYRAMRGTLALQLAVHSAFRTHLVIVGMSLEDSYLREQIAEFRDQINEVIWFVTAPPTKAIAAWCYANSVAILQAPSWDSFWQRVSDELPAPTEEAIVGSWMSALQTAAEVTNPRGAGHTLAMFRKLGSSEDELIKWKAAFQAQGLTVPDLAEEESAQPFANSAELMVPLMQYSKKLFLAKS